MAEDIEGEIDTILEASESKAAAGPAAQLKSLGAEISLASEIESTKGEVSEAAALPEKMFFFNDYPRKVYCTVSGIRLRLIQTGEGRGIAYLTFTQTCNSRRSTVAKGPDWTFSVGLYDSQNAFIRNIHLGYWNHRCGKHLVELREDFSWVLGSINPVINAYRANLNWQFLQRVHNCG
ncbi:MAG TPA: hypothetical protein VNJ31_08675 [Methyloceanibacter sp.]|nr:hypothetical protein [Methyloceanibacter sp.]